MLFKKTLKTIFLSIFLANNNPAIAIPELINAARKNHTELVLTLIQDGYNVNEQSAYGWSALHYAILNNNLEISRALINHREININIKNHNNWTPLHLASNQNRVEILDILVKHPDIDTNLQNDNQEIPLELTSSYDAANAIITHPNSDKNHNSKTITLLYNTLFNIVAHNKCGKAILINTLKCHNKILACLGWLASTQRKLLSKIHPTKKTD